MKGSDLMQVYTKTGDKGKTSLYDNKRVFKDDIRVESYGTIDELNASLGVAKNFVENEELKAIIHNIQRKLFDIGAELATEDKEKLRIKEATEEDIKILEKLIDYYLESTKKVDHRIWA